MAWQGRVSLFLAFVLRSLLWSVHIGLFFYTLFIYYLLWALPSEHWLASMLMITLPLAWVGLIGLALVWLFFRPWRALLTVAALLMGYWLWPRTVGMGTDVPNPTNRPVLELLSFNVSAFRLNEYYSSGRKDTLTARHLADWVVEHPAPVKCLQEFYSGDDAPAFGIYPRLVEAGYVYQALLQPIENKYIGVATFSKYPILAQGCEAFGTFNGLVWSDIKIGADTVRIINVHLQSMGIRVRKVFENEEMEAMKSETRSVLGALKAGFVARRQQVEVIEQRIDDSPYPVIVTGDFNDTAYSVVYERLRRRLRNAQEDAGSGLGFTLNRAPRFIRIDNQFYDPRLPIRRFKTDRDMGLSDHFSILGEYFLRK